jgi:hypothetical protein
MAFRSGYSFQQFRARCCLRLEKSGGPDTGRVACHCHKAEGTTPPFKPAVMAPVKLKRFPKARFPLPPAPARALPPFPFLQPFRDKPPPVRILTDPYPFHLRKFLRREGWPEIAIPLPIRLSCPSPHFFRHLPVRLFPRIPVGKPPGPPLAHRRHISAVPAGSLLSALSPPPLSLSVPVSPVPFLFLSPVRGNKVFSLSLRQSPCLFVLLPLSCTRGHFYCGNTRTLSLRCNRLNEQPQGKPCGIY